MRPRILVAFLAVATWAGGCTFLIDFNEVDPLPDAASNDGGAKDAADATGEGDALAADTGPPAFPPPCDPTFPLADVACNASYPRPNCASNTTVFPAYPAGHDRTNDLVTCNGSATPTCVQHCPFGCASMPAGYPDACDDCNGRPDGTYCVKDLQGPDGRNLGLAVDCKGGKTVLGHVCGVGKCATVCPRSAPLPSCCI
jgi:hypothetical protein